MSRFPINGILKLLEKENNFVFLETARPDEENFLSYIFLRPKRVVFTHQAARIKDCFARLEQALKAGDYVAGFLAYEAGEAFEERLQNKQVYQFPLLWFGIYKHPLVYNHRQGKFAAASAQAQHLVKQLAAGALADTTGHGYTLTDIRPNISAAAYERAIAQIKALIAQGLTYQVNYTFKLKFGFCGSPAAFYLNLRNHQSVAYSALVKAGRRVVLSFSPELFFRKSGRHICVRPMKGTARRGRDLTEDSLNAHKLKGCLKNRSENIMIVDLLRNDLGRISQTGSVKVPRLFSVEGYETLLQMTSDIESRLKSPRLAFNIFSQIFPSGSVTGAPKIKTMQLIKKLEQEPRGIYTGSIGFFSPENSGAFNVAIRTILLDTKNKTGEMGVGSGIVYDSCAKEEFAECRLKADFLTSSQDFQLIETMLWRPHQGYLLLAGHLRRLQDSAGYFKFTFNRQAILEALKGLARGLGRNDHKVRLLLSKDGRIKLSASLLEALPQEPRVILTSRKTHSANPFLYHKTTHRRFYDEEYDRYRRLGFYEVIFTNEKGEVTEGAVSNVLIKKRGRFLTPPITSGILDGVYRRYLFSAKASPLKEKVLFKQDLYSADEIYLSNSVRGLVKVHLAK